MSHQLGVVIKDQGAAIVTVDLDAKDDAVVVAIEPLPFNVDIVANRVLELDASEPRDARFLIDAEGLGYALWSIVAPPKRSRRWELYEDRGLERQELVDQLVVTMYDDALHFVSDLEAMELMTRALIGYRRQVREDGQIGSELVVALCLAITPRPKKKTIAWLA